MISTKAQKQIVELEHEIKKMKEDIDKYRQLQYQNYSDKGLQRYYRGKETYEERKYYKYLEKLEEIKKYGLAISELATLKRELSTFKSLSYGRSLGSKDNTVLGYSKVLNNYVIVNYTKWTDFMRNVQGCSSMAGQKDIRSIKIISKDQYDRIVSQEKVPTRRPTGWERRREPSKYEILGGMQW
jgi:hypothetical protein